MGIEKVKEIVKTLPEYASKIDLASEKLGGKVLFATDDFFAEKENLIKPGRGIFVVDKYTDRGKWMDGWESRRKRTAGNDWCIVQLAAAGRIYGFDIDTNFFLGNHPPHASVEAATIADVTNINNWETDVPWKEILAKSHLDPGSQNFYSCEDKTSYTHLRLNIFPDGGVARLRVYGEITKDWNRVNKDEVIDLCAALNGGKAIACNDMFFSAMDNLLMPDRGANMGDGWETKRNRTPNNRDWVIIRLGHPGIIEKFLVDTCHFKGNYPDRCTVEGCMASDDNDVITDIVQWHTILPEHKLSADNEHLFPVQTLLPCSHIRLNIFPDGGVSRLRAFGKKYTK